MTACACIDASFRASLERELGICLKVGLYEPLGTFRRLAVSTMCLRGDLE